MFKSLAHNFLQALPPGAKNRRKNGLPTSTSGSLGACREGRERNGCRLRSGAYSKRYLPQLRALDPMPVLGGTGGVSSILNGIVKLA